MGIRGLRSYVRKNGILRPFILTNTRVVIDGNNICHQLLFEGTCRNYGGDYGELREETKRFFRRLKQCHINPYVVFDGAYDNDDKKLMDIQRKCESRIHEMEESGTQNMECTPILMYETFKMVLRQMKVSHVTCMGEADNQIAELAKHWKCPIISCDSDMYIFDLPGGVIHLSDMWPNDSSGAEIKTKLYLASSFENKSGLAASLLPLAATILGNAYIKLDEQIVKRFYKRLGRASGHSSYLDTVVFNLRRAKGIEDGLKILMECVEEKTPKEESAAVKKKIMTSVACYNVATESEYNLANYFADERDTRCHWCLPERVVQKIRYSYMSGLPIDVVNGRVILKPTLEEYELPPIQQICLSLRQLFYGIVIKSCSLEKKISEVIEIVREKRQMTRKKVSPKYEILGYDTMPTVQYIDTLNKTGKLKILAAIFSFQTELLMDVPEESRLFALALNYFIDHGLDKSEAFHYKSYILCHVLLLKKENHAEIKDEYDRLSTIYSGNWNDVRVFHVYLQSFHECLNMAYTINVLVGTPVTQPDPATVYDGKLMFDVFCEHRSKGKVNRMVSECFAKYPPLRRHYKTIADKFNII